MTDLIQLMQKIKTKEMEPKIYAISVEGHTGEGVTIVVDYTLEDACAQAKEDAQKHMGGDIRDFRVRHWAALDMERFKDKILTLDYPKKKAKTDSKMIPTANKYKKEDINRLMKFVVDKKDMDLLNVLVKTGGITATEYKYLYDKIKSYDRRGKGNDSGTA